MDDSSKYFQEQYPRSWVMRIMVQTEVYDKPSVQCDCDARRPMSAVGIKVESASFSVWIQLQLTDSTCSAKSRHSDALKKGEAPQP